MRFVRTVWLMLAVGLLSACAPPITGLVRDKTFTYQNLTSAKIFVGGVDSALQPLSAADRSRYSDILLRQFREERNAFEYSPAGELSNRIGADKYRQILDNYGVMGVVSDANLSLIRDAIPTARYVIFARIESTGVRRERNEDEADVVPVSSSSDKKKEKDEEPKQVKVTVSFRAIRDIDVSMMIYDLTSGVSVWSGALKQNYNNVNQQSRTFDKDNRWSEELIDVAVRQIIGKHSESDMYPEPPSLASTLDSVFAGFALNMPEED